MKRLYNVGDIVTVVGHGGRTYTDGVYWNNHMDCLIGKTGVVSWCGYFNDYVPVCTIDFPDRAKYDITYHSRDWAFNEKWLKFSGGYDGAEDNIDAEDISMLW